MNCSRCASRMIQTEPLRFYASTDISEQSHGIAYKCPICGNVEDNRIRMNRKEMLEMR